MKVDVLGTYVLCLSSGGTDPACGGGPSSCLGWGRPGAMIREVMKMENGEADRERVSGEDVGLGPVQFVRRTLGETPYDKQREILRAVSLHRRVSVVGCHGSGKDWAAARAALWWVTAHYPAKAIVTGPTERQVDDIVWNEMRTAHARAGAGLGGRMFKTPRYEVDEQAFALGFSTSSPYNLQGFHSPNLLVVVTEAHAVAEEHVDALSRLNPDRLLLVGNAYSVPGAFYDSHHSKRWLYRTIRISAFDTPNVSRGWEWAPGMVHGSGRGGPEGGLG